jgi:hypothetical protein
LNILSHWNVLRKRPSERVGIYWFLHEIIWLLRGFHNLGRNRATILGFTIIFHQNRGLRIAGL